MKLKNVINRIKDISEKALNTPEYTTVDEWVIIENLRINNLSFYMGIHMHYPEDKRIAIFDYEGEEKPLSKIKKYLDTVICNFCLYDSLFHLFYLKMYNKYKEGVPNTGFSMFIRDMLDDERRIGLLEYQLAEQPDIFEPDNIEADFFIRNGDKRISLRGSLSPVFSNRYSVSESGKYLFIAILNSSCMIKVEEVIGSKYTGELIPTKTDEPVKCNSDNFKDVVWHEDAGYADIKYGESEEYHRVVYDRTLYEGNS